MSEAGGHYSLGDEADAPAIVVCTPRHLAALVRGPVILHEGLFESVRHVVLDEVLRSIMLAYFAFNFVLTWLRHRLTCCCKDPI